MNIGHNFPLVFWCPHISCLRKRILDMSIWTLTIWLLPFLSCCQAACVFHLKKFASAMVSFLNFWRVCDPSVYLTILSGGSHWPFWMHDFADSDCCFFVGLWLHALGCSLLVSLASLICLIILPVMFSKWFHCEYILMFQIPELEDVYWKLSLLAHINVSLVSCIF